MKKKTNPWYEQHIRLIRNRHAQTQDKVNGPGTKAKAGCPVE